MSAEADDGVNLEEWVLAQAVVLRDGVGQGRGLGRVHVRAARQQGQHRAGDGETLAAWERGLGGRSQCQPWARSRGQAQPGGRVSGCSVGH